MVLKKEEKRWTRRPEKRKAEVEKEKEREERRKRLLLKESVSTLFPVMLFRNSVTWRIRTVAVILGASFWVTPVVYLSVPSTGVPVVTNVPNSPSSMVVIGEALLSDSDL